MSEEHTDGDAKTAGDSGGEPPGSPVTPPSPKRSVLRILVVALVIAGAAYLLVPNELTGTPTTGAYAPVEAAPEFVEDVYVATEVEPFAIAAGDVPLRGGLRWAYEGAFGQYYEVECLGQVEVAGQSFFLQSRSIDDLLLADVYIQREGDTITEFTSVEERKINMIYQYPLEVGGRWTYSISVQNNAGVVEDIEFTVSVEAAEKVTVPAGEYPCLRLTIARSGDAEAGTRLWVSPGVGTVRFSTRRGGGVELTSFEG